MSDQTSAVLVFGAFCGFLLTAREIGRWGVLGAFRSRWPSVAFGLLLILPAVINYSALGRFQRTLWFLAIAVFPVALWVFRARHVGTWQVIGINMNKVSLIGDLYTALLKRMMKKRLWVAGGFQVSGHPLDVLGTILKEDGDWRVRRCAAEVIGEWDAETSLSYLEDGLKNTNWRVQLECLKGLMTVVGSWRGKREPLASVLEDVAQNAGNDSRVREAAARYARYLRA